MAYREGLHSRSRKQLGFALKDISEHLPGAFIIYRADKENDELFYANHEFLHMAGYKDIDELFKLTKEDAFETLSGKMSNRRLRQVSGSKLTAAMKMTIFIFIFEKLMELTFLYLIMEE